jgi:hypothetical protein
MIFTKAEASGRRRARAWNPRGESRSSNGRDQRGAKIIVKGSLMGLAVGLVMNPTFCAWGASPGTPSRGRLVARHSHSGVCAVR